MENNKFKELLNSLVEQISLSTSEKLQTFILESIVSIHENENSLISTELLCEKLSLSKSTIIKLRRDGMPYLRIGDSIRFELSEVKKYLIENHKIDNHE